MPLTCRQPEEGERITFIEQLLHAKDYSKYFNNDDHTHYCLLIIW